MPNPVITALIEQVTKTRDVNASATTLINGIAARIQTAVDAAIQNGATAAELAPVTDEIALLNNSSTALSDAITANTPAAA